MSSLSRRIATRAAALSQTAGVALCSDAGPAERVSPSAPGSLAPSVGARSTRAFHARRRPMAIAATALGAEYEQTASPAPTQSTAADAAGVAIVDICGPLTHHADPWFDCYDAIRERVAAALASRARSVMLRIDSPGGEVSGCFETARTIRQMAESAGKPLISYVDAQACSAAYALACAAPTIVSVEEGVTGSIGVIAELWDVTAADAAAGVAVSLVTSGARKADGHEHAPVTDEVRSAVQAHVDDEAAIFWRWVSVSRGLPESDIQALQASHYHGAEALSRGLIDAVGGFDVALAMVASADSAAANRGEGSNSMAKMGESIRKLLLDAAAEDSDEGRSAKRALEAWDKAEEPEEKPKDDKEPDGDEGADDESDSDAADEESDSDAADEESDAELPEKSQKAKKASDSDAIVAAFLKASALRDSAARERNAKARLLKTSGFAAPVCRVLMRASLAEVREAVKSRPRQTAEKQTPAAKAVAATGAQPAQAPEAPKASEIDPSILERVGLLKDQSHRQIIVGGKVLALTRKAG